MNRVENLSTLHRLRIRTRQFAPRSLPDFLVIGAQRSGTTTLFEYLSAHDSVRPPVRKEVHYFSSHYSRGVRWYRAHFPVALARVRPWQTFECTPYYLVHPQVPERVRRDLPDARLVAVLRDPVERLLSQYRMNVSRGIETRSLRAAIAAEQALEDGPAEDRSSPAERRTYSYLARGRYAEQIERWFAQFPREQLHLIDFDDLVHRPQATLEAVFQFLRLESVRDSATFHAGYRTDHSVPGPEANELREYYRAYDDRLSEVAGRTFRWQR